MDVACSDPLRALRPAEAGLQTVSQEMLDEMIGTTYFPCRILVNWFR